MKTSDFASQPNNNPTDTVSVDVPLLIRLLEYAREDAKTDMDLHNVAEQLIALSKNNQTLTMREYDKIVGTTQEPQDYPEITAESLTAKFDALLGECASAGATGAASIGAVVSPLGQGPAEIIRRQKNYTNQKTKGGPVKVKK